MSSFTLIDIDTDDIISTQEACCLPRIGDEIMFIDDEFVHNYRVISITHRYVQSENKFSSIFVKVDEVFPN